MKRNIFLTLILSLISYTSVIAADFFGQDYLFTRAGVRADRTTGIYNGQPAQNVHDDLILTRQTVAEGQENENPLFPDQEEAQDYNGQDLTGVNMQNENYKNSNFTATCLHGSEITSSFFSNALFSDADLVDAAITWCFFDNASLAGADLTTARITSTIFENADFSNATLTLATFKNCSFKNANLCGANFSFATFKGHCDFTGAQLNSSTQGDKAQLIKLGAIMTFKAETKKRPFESLR